MVNMATDPLLWRHVRDAIGVPPPNFFRDVADQLLGTLFMGIDCRLVEVWWYDPERRETVIGYKSWRTMKG